MVESYALVLKVKIPAGLHNNAGVLPLLTEIALSLFKKCHPNGRF